MKITSQTQNWGNSTGIRLPKKVLQTVNWSPSQEVSIDVRGQSIVLTPVKKLESQLPTIAQLLKNATPDNDIHWGLDRGNEIIDD